MKSILAVLLTVLVTLCSAQQRPVTHQEFRDFFTKVLTSLGVPEDKGKQVFAFEPNATALSKAELAAALISAAKLLGKSVPEQGDPISRLKAANILPKSSAFFSNPGIQFRPSDMVKAVIGFVDGVSGGPAYGSVGESTLTPPKIGRNITR